MANPAADFAELMGIAASDQRSRALTVATELGIADLLRDGPRHVADLAQATYTHEPTLYRLLRALASIGMFHEDGERSFSLTPMGQLLAAARAILDRAGVADRVRIESGSFFEGVPSGADAYVMRGSCTTGRTRKRSRSSVAAGRRCGRMHACC